MCKPRPSNGPEPDERNERKRLLLLTLTLFSFVVAVYLPTFRYGYLFDESIILFGTVPPRSISELCERLWAPHFPGLEYFRPIPHATYLIQYMWDANEPGYFHLFNALLMGATASVSFALLRLPCFRISTLPAAFAAALFAVHPASSSCVTPIVGRETLIGACLTISAVYAFFRGGRPWYVASLFLLFLALLSKEQAIITPVLFVFGDLLGLAKDAPGRRVGRWLRRYFPVVLAVMIYLAIRWSFFSGTEYRVQIVDHPFGPLLAVGYAVQTVLTPFGELAYEPVLGVWLSYWRLVITACLLGLLGWTVRVHFSTLKYGVLFWFGWFLLTIAPTANVIEQQTPYSERYVLLATFAVVAVAASVVSTMQESPKRRFWMTLLGPTVIVVSAATTVHRGACCENALTFSQQWAKTSPEFGEAQTALGMELHLLGRTEEAADCFRAGTKCEPATRSNSHQMLGTMLLILGRFAEADQQFQFLLDQESANSSLYFLSGVALRALGETDRAVARFRQAVRISPDDGGTHFLLADTIESQEGDTQLSLQHRSIAARSRVIDLAFSGVTDSHLKELSRFRNLRGMRLDSTSISDEGVKHLCTLTALNRLWMPGTAVTDRGLRHVRDLPSLNSLVLVNTDVTDSGVTHLLSMRSLTHLDVRYTGITRKGIWRLKSGLPDCLILY